MNSSRAILSFPYQDFICNECPYFSCDMCSEYGRPAWDIEMCDKLKANWNDTGLSIKYPYIK